MNINNLLEDICIRHACKNVNKYIADFEHALDIKLKPGDHKNEYCYTERFKWISDLCDKRDLIRKVSKRLTTFSIININIDDHILFVKFEFHPENTV